MNNVTDYINYLVDWLETKRTAFYNANGYVLGVSGGIDSAVCLALLARTKRPVHAFMLPTDVNQASDLADASELLSRFNINEQIISIQPMYDAVMTQIESTLNPNPDRLNVLKGNLMARLRMVTLFTIAQSHNALVIGTDNLAETYTGYFTKFGDGAADLIPLAKMRKEQVYALAKELQVPDSIINKKPSAGLWLGQTDEDELGVTYAELDAFLRGESVSEHAQQRIDFWHNRSHHKRVLPLSPELELKT